MARDLRLQITGDSKIARKALDDVADEAEKTARATEVLGSEFRKAAKDSGWLEKNLKDTSTQSKQTNTAIVGLGKATEKTADEFRQAAAAAAKLDAQLAVTRAEITKLNKAYAEGGDATVLKNLQKQLGEQDRLVRLKTRLLRDEQEAAKKNDPLEALEKQYAVIERTARLKRRIAKDEEDAHKENERRNAAAAAAAKLLQRNRRGVLRNTLGDLFGLGIGGVKAGASGLADATSKIPGGKLALGVVGAGAVPAAGALGGAALLGGAGLAGIGTGIAGAVANNPEPFRKAWTAAIQDISIKWQRSSSEFEKPTLEAIQILRNAAMDIDLAGPFKEASKWVQPLALGIGGLVKGIGEGVGILIKGSGPVLGVLAKDLPKIGLAFKQLSKDVAGSADGAGEALHDILDFTGAFIVSVGKGISVLSNFYKRGNAIYDGIINANTKLTGIKLFGGQDQQVMTYARSLDSAKRSTFDMAQAQKEMGEAARAASDAFHEQTNLMLGLEEAQDQAYIALQNLKQGFKENGAAIQGNSAAALENRDNLREVRAAYEEVRLKAIEAAGDSQAKIREANQAYVAHLQELREILRAHGQNTAELDKYIEDFKRMNGLTATQYIRVIYYEEGASKGLPKNLGGRYGGSDNHAGGGTFMSSGPKIVNEQGPELIWGSKGQFVSTAQQTKQLMATWATMANGGGGGSAPTVSLTAAAPAGGSLEQAIISLFVGGVRGGRIKLKDGNGRRVEVA